MPPIVVARQWPPMDRREPDRHDRNAGVASMTRVLVITATRLETRAARSVLDGRLTVLRVGVGGRPKDFGTAQAIIDTDAEKNGFRKYLRSFGDYETLVKDMKKRFKFLGDSGAYIFLYTVKEKVPDYHDWREAHPTKKR